MSTTPQYNLSPEDAVTAMRAELASMTGRKELSGTDPDQAFLYGYEAAIHDNIRFRGPDPVDTGDITIKETDR